jgi:hypothetical protein
MGSISLGWLTDHDHFCRIRYGHAKRDKSPTFLYQIPAKDFSSPGSGMANILSRGDFF